MEAFQQHAEHYIRVMNEAQRQVAERREQMESQNRNNNNDDQRAQNQQRHNQNSQNKDNSNGANRNGGQPVADLSKEEQPDIVSAPADKIADNQDDVAKAKSVPIEVVDNSGGLVFTANLQSCRTLQYSEFLHDAWDQFRVPLSDPRYQILSLLKSYAAFCGAD